MITSNTKRGTAPVRSRLLWSVYERGTDWKLMLLGVGILAVGQFAIADNDASNRGASHLGMFLMAVGLSTIAVSAFLFHRRLPKPTWMPNFDARLRFANGGVQRIGFGIGIASSAFLALRLLGNSESGSDVWWWLIALVGMGVGFSPPMSRVMVHVRRALRSIRFIDVAVPAAIVAVFVAVNVSDLTDWFYVIGDEYVFYERSEWISDEGLKRPFSQDGAYNRHPMLGIAMKSVVMNIVGTDHFGWKFSSVAMIALTIPGLYLLGTTLGGRVAGAVSAAMVGFSHYIFALAHTGYNQPDSLLPIVWAIAVFALAVRRGSPFLLFIAGFLAGFCFYSFAAARVAIPIVVLFVLVSPFFLARLRSLFFLAVGISVALIPALIVNGMYFFTVSLENVVGLQGEASELSLVSRVATNLELNILAFHFNERMSHYISGPLFDPISGLIGAAALAFAVGTLRDPASRLLCIWFGLAFIAAGIASPYYHVVVTRMFAVVPPVALATGLFVSRFVWPTDINFRLADTGRLLANSKSVVVSLIVAVGIAVLVLNFQRFREETPAVHQSSPAGTGIGAMRSVNCADNPMERIAFVSRDEHLIRRVLDSYEPGSVRIDPNEGSEIPGSPTFLNHQQAIENGIANSSAFGCIIFTHPWEPDPDIVLSDLRETHPGGVLTPFSDRSGKTTVIIFQPR